MLLRLIAHTALSVPLLFRFLMDLGILLGISVWSISEYFRDLGCQTYGIDASVDFLVIWGWKSCQNWMLGCAETMQKTSVFVIFHFFIFSWFWCLQGGLGTSFWRVWEYLGHHFGDFRGSWRGIEISMDLRISPGAPLGASTEEEKVKGLSPGSS